VIRLDIINDGTGDKTHGNYDAYIYIPVDGQVIEYHARVEDFPRAHGWASLVNIATVYLSSSSTREERTVDKNILDELKGRPDGN
jgi:hypothetical protein